MWTESIEGKYFYCYSSYIYYCRPKGINRCNLASILLLSGAGKTGTRMNTENRSLAHLMETQGMKKEYDMQSLNELIKALSEPEVSMRDAMARSTNTCKLCGKSARRFRDRISEFEYKVSAICQRCQDKFFG